MSSPDVYLVYVVLIVWFIVLKNMSVFVSNDKIKIFNQPSYMKYIVLLMRTMISAYAVYDINVYGSAILKITGFALKWHKSNS